MASLPPGNDATLSHSDSILLVGAAHIDRYGRCEGPPVSGGSNPGRFANMPGGAAFNVASSLCALGADARLHSILGSDADARYLQEIADARGIVLRTQVSSIYPTATYTSIIAPDGVLALALADMAIYSAFDPAQVENTNDGSWLLVDANLTTDAIAALLTERTNHTAAMTVSYAKAGRLRSNLNRIAVVFTNRAELAALCDGVADEPMEQLLKEFHALGGRGAVVTDGPADIWTVEDGAVLRHPVPAAPEIVDVTGAGDGLTAGCLMALMAGRSIADAVPFGIRTAQAVLAVHGPWRVDLASKIAQT